MTSADIGFGAASILIDYGAITKVVSTRVRFPLVANEWVSIELHVSTPISEWDGKTWYARFEETAQITDDGVKWLKIIIGTLRSSVRSRHELALETRPDQSPSLFERNHGTFSCLRSDRQ